MATLSKHDIEESLLSALLHNPESIPEAVSVCDDPDLMDEDTNRQLWKGILDMYAAENGPAPDPTSLMSHVSQRGYLTKDTAKERLARIVQLQEHAGNVEGWAEELLGLKNRRDLRSLLPRVKSMIEDPEADLDSIQKEMTDAMAERHSIAEPARASDVAVSMLDRLDGKQVGYMPGNLKTGMPELDNLIDGVMDTDLVGILARPKWGKTSFMVQMIVGQKLIYPEGHIDVFSMEMSEQRMTYRIVSQISGVPYQTVKHVMRDPGEIGGDEKQAVRSAAERVAGWEGELRIYTGSMTPREVCQIVRANTTRDAAAGNDHLSVFIDNFQSFGKVVQREQMEEASSLIKDVTLDCESPVFLLSQVNRKCEDQNRPPRIKDSKGTGQLEQDFDRAITIDRPDMRNPHMSVDELRSMGIREGWAVIGLDKNREGKEGTFEKYFHGPTMQFVDQEPEESEAGDAMLAGAGRGDPEDDDVETGSAEDAEDIFNV
jgi:replicative DNA helicase